MKAGSGGGDIMSIPKSGDMDTFRVQLVTTLAQHDSAINTLGGRMTGVETGLNSLQKEMHVGFTSVATAVAGLGSQLAKSDAQPRIDYHETIRSIVSIAALFSMIVAGIIWITANQFGTVIAEQKGFNSAIKHRVDKVEDAIGQWRTRTVADQARR